MNHVQIDVVVSHEKIRICIDRLTQSHSVNPSMCISLCRPDEERPLRISLTTKGLRAATAIMTTSQTGKNATRVSNTAFG